MPQTMSMHSMVGSNVLTRFTLARPLLGLSHKPSALGVTQPIYVESRFGLGPSPLHR